MGMTFSDYTVTEAGFGFDLGAEKFFDIKCQSAGLSPKAVVLTTTIRALKYHGGAALETLTTPDVEALKSGLPNLEKHLENIRQFNVIPVIAINRFTTDSEEEIKLIQDKAEEIGIRCAVADLWAKGGEGAEELAKLVVEVAESNPPAFDPMYDWNWDVKKKIETLATKIYGAEHVDYTPQAKMDLKKIQELGLGDHAHLHRKNPEIPFRQSGPAGTTKGFHHHGQGDRDSLWCRLPDTDHRKHYENARITGPAGFRKHQHRQ